MSKRDDSAESRVADATSPAQQSTRPEDRVGGQLVPAPNAASRCGRTREELDQLSRDTHGQELYWTHFFLNAEGTRNFPRDDDLDDDMVRCKRCGRVIAEHPSSPQFVAGASWQLSGTLPTAIKPDSILDEKWDTSVAGLRFVDVGEATFAKESDRMVRPGEYYGVWKCLTTLLNVDDTVDTRGMLIKGHPGIGKSMLLDLLVSMTLQAYPTVPIVGVATRHIDVILPVTGQRWRIGKNEVEQLDQEILRLGVPRASRLLVFHDVNATLPFRTAMITSVFQTFITTCVVASSPNQRNFHDFHKAVEEPKNSSFKTYIVPTLDEYEARAFVKFIDPSATPQQFEVRFEQVGGVPLHLKRDQTANTEVARQKAKVGLVRYDPSSTATDEDTHAIVKMVPTQDRVECNFDFVSRSAAQLWVKRHDGTDRTDALLRALLRARDQSTRDVYGRFFEEWTLKVLVDGTRLERCRLDGTKDPRPWQTPHGVSRLSFSGGASLEPVTFMSSPTLYVPMSSNFPVVDAIYSRTEENVLLVTLIQVTVGETQDLKREKLVLLLEAVKRRKPQDAKSMQIEFLWLVDKNSQLLTKQPRGTVLQQNSIEEWVAVMPMSPSTDHRRAT